ncbi:MAG: hypothetical protein II998_02595 [Clostridia bacterium]|nr:hypothetical protein [Clostridia bacterium]
MKFKFTKILCLILTMVLMVSFTACDSDDVPEADLSNLPEIPGVDFRNEIEFFDEQPGINTFTIDVDEIHAPYASVWFSNDNTGSKGYTSDSSVVIVGKNGHVKGVKEGTAYVLLHSSMDLYAVFKYYVK